MHASWNARNVAIAAATLALVGFMAQVGAQDKTRSAPRPKDTQDAPKADEVRSKFLTRESLDDYYEKRFAELDKERIADMAALAPKLKDAESEGTYSELFNLAVTRDQYEAAEKAAEEFLKSGKGSPQTRSLASFVNIIAATNRGHFDQAIQDLDEFLKGMAGSDPVAAIDPNLTFAVGEAFLQKLIRAREYQSARKVCQTFIDGTQDPNVKEHFAGRLARIDMLGRAAPEIVAEDVDGKPVKLADYRSKVVLVDFWATWAPPCVAQIPSYNALQAKYGPKGFQVLGVNVDGANQNVKEKGGLTDHVRRFLLAMRVAWPTVLNGDGAKDFAKIYGVTDIPANFLIDRDGKIVQLELSDTDLEDAIERALGGEKAGKPGEDASKDK